MDRWAYRQTDTLTDGWVDRQTVRQMYKWRGRQMEGWTDRHMGKWKDGQIDIWANGQVEKQTYEKNESWRDGRRDKQIKAFIIKINKMMYFLQIISQFIKCCFSNQLSLKQVLNS